VTSYGQKPHPTLRQGDIVLAPSAILQPGETDLPVPEAPLVLGESVRAPAWIVASSQAPAMDVEACWSPVLVLSHDCELEKEFNERVYELIAGGMSEEEAVSDASADPTLDPFAVVAPLLPYGEFPAERHAGIRSGQRIGALPIDVLPLDGGDYVVDLFRPTTVSVYLLPQAAKVASLAPASVFELRYKLSEAYASRDLAVLAEIEAVVGHTIVGVEALPRGQKKTSLVLHLADAESVHLEIRRPRDELPEEVTRLPRP
jgi:hypothetical protein